MSWPKDYFNPEQNLRLLENLGRAKISQTQFCQIIGRLRLYQALPASQLRELPKVILGDSNVNAATKGYIENPNFELRGRENISCCDLMQLLNETLSVNRFVPNQSSDQIYWCDTLHHAGPGLFRDIHCIMCLETGLSLLPFKQMRDEFIQTPAPRQPFVSRTLRLVEVHTDIHVAEVLH